MKLKLTIFRRKGSPFISAFTGEINAELMADFILIDNIEVEVADHVIPSPEELRAESIEAERAQLQARLDAL